MDLFNKKKIILDIDVVVEELRENRRRKGLELEKIAKELNIKIEYLQALERGDFSILPIGIYGRNILRRYAEFLGIDKEELIKIFEQEKAVSSQQKAKGLFVQRASRIHYFLFLPKIIKGIVVSSVVLACFLYLAFGLKKIVAPPFLKIIYPPNDFVTAQHNIEIRGITEPEAEVAINGEMVLTNNDGSFTKVVNLKSGLNVVDIVAQKRYSQKHIIKRQILVK